MKSTVDVFEVGVAQLEEWLSRKTIVCRVLPLEDMYAVVFRFYAFGGQEFHEVILDDTSYYLDEDLAVEDAENSERHNLDILMRGLAFKDGLHCEVWHVVDDADLWQSWEHDVECAKEENATTLESLRMLRAAGVLDALDASEVSIRHAALWWVDALEYYEEADCWLPNFCAIFYTEEKACAFARRIVGYPFERVTVGKSDNPNRVIHEYLTALTGRVSTLKSPVATSFFDGPAPVFDFPTRHGVLLRRDSDYCDEIPF